MAAVEGVNNSLALPASCSLLVTDGAASSLAVGGEKLFLAEKGGRGVIHSQT